MIRHKLIALLLNKQDAVTNIASVVAILMGRTDRLDIYGAVLSAVSPTKP